VTVKCTAGVHREICDQYIAACIVKPPWLIKAFECTVCDIKHHKVVSSGIFADQFRHPHPHEWMKHALNTLEEPTEAYMVEVIPECHIWKQQLIS